jgi:hypothetical protein
MRKLHYYTMLDYTALGVGMVSRNLVPEEFNVIPA